ncbi:MAG: hypothetical protein II357_03795 [Clostridia bacterium]|nr:hypothetical protein [Clostridia bacterium]
MKKKVLLLTAITVVVLLAGTVIGFAVDAANKSAEAEAAAQAEAKAAEKAAAKAAQKELEIQKVLSELQVSPDSQAGQVLIEVLSKKEMSERDIMIYNEMSDEIKKMDYEAVSAKLKEYADVEQTLAEKSWNEAMADESFRERVAQMLIYKEYAEAIAVGEPLYEQNHMLLSDYSINGKRMALMHIEGAEEYLEKYPNEPNTLRRIYLKEQWIIRCDFIGEMLEIFEQRKAEGYNIHQLNDDMKSILDYIKTRKSEVGDPDEDYSYIKTRYLAGESIEDIVK